MDVSTIYKYILMIVIHITYSNFQYKYFCRIEMRIKYILYRIIYNSGKNALVSTMILHMTFIPIYLCTYYVVIYIFTNIYIKYYHSFRLLEYRYLYIFCVDRIL
jgi:hypothetical protein